MIVALSLMIISFLAMIGMLHYRPAFIFSDRSDRLVEGGGTAIRRFFHRWNWRTLRLLYHFLIQQLENLLLKAYSYLRKRFDKPVNMVKGQGNIEDSSKNSFFLKNIEEHKNNDKLPG